MKRRNAHVSIPSAESAELLGDVFTVLVHDLGAIATALSLRAEVLKGVVPAADHSALMALAGQLAELKKTMRVVQGPRQSQSLAPEAVLTSTLWFRLAKGFAAPSLPRGTQWKEEIGAPSLTSAHANALLYLWLCACRALPVAVTDAPPVLTVTLSERPEARVGAELVATLMLPANGEDVAAAHTIAGETAGRALLRWRRYAERLARRNGAHMEWWTRSGSRWTWRCIIE